MHNRWRRSGGGTPRAAAGRGRRRLLAAAALPALLLLGTAWTGGRGYLAIGHLERAARLFTQVARDLQAGDAARARTDLGALRRETGAARADTADPVWRATTGLPRVGDDLGAVHAIAAALDDLSRYALPPLLEIAAGLSGGLAAPPTLPPGGPATPAGGGPATPAAGGLDLGPLVGAGPHLARAAAAVQRAIRTVDRIPTGGLAPHLRTAVGQLDRGLHQAARLLDAAGLAARLLPPVLGADRPRSYLVLFQNLAEARATGGMPGAYLVIRADRGRVRIIDQGGSAAAIRSFPAPVVPLTEDQQALYTDRLGVYPADVNLTPDFPTAARIYREMYRLRSGRTVDGVLATDPVALSYLLRATGPVPMPTGPPLAAGTVVRLLLQQTYAAMTSSAQKDAYFASAARATFDALVRMHPHPGPLLGALSRAAAQRRLLAWSADPVQEQALAGTVLAGRLPARDGDTPTVGVFLNDGSGSKLSYYLTHSAALRVGECDPDGGRELRLHLTLGSTAPPRGLPRYVLGLGLSGHPYVVRTNVMIFSPTGGGILGASRGGAEVDLGTGTEGDREVGVLTVDLAPGASQSFDVTLLTGDTPAAAGALAPRLWTTPGVAPWPTTIVPGGPCGK
jgi:Protein of unknown function (DUF4012)